MKDYHNHKEFVCPHCGKDFSKKRKLKQHLTDAHKQELDGMSVAGLKGSEAGTKLRESVEALKDE